MPQGVEGLMIGGDTYYIGPCPERTDDIMLLCRIPQGECRPIPVCGKSGCQHDDCSCDGFCRTFVSEEFSSLKPSVGFFQNRLYMLSLLPERKIAVYSVDPETAERRLELTLDPQEVYETEMSGIYVTGAFHENYLILLYYQDHGNIGNGPLHRMIVVDLATRKQNELFRSHFDEHIGTHYMTVLGGPIAVGNMLYLLEDGPGSMPDSDENIPERRFSQMNITNGEVTQLLRNNDLYTWKIEGDIVFFSDQHEKRFKEFNLTTRTLTVFPSDEEITGESFYLDDMIIRIAGEFDLNTQTSNTYFVFYSRDYAFIDELEYCGELVLFLSTDEALYFQNDVGIFYLDRSEIGSNNLKLQLLR